MIHDIGRHKDKWLINFSRIGIASKGIVYCLLGVITLLVSLGYKKSKVGKEEVFKTILEQPFGKILLVLITLGLLGFVVWRVIQAIKDPYHKGSNFKGIIIRIGYLWSALIYIGITSYAASMALNGGSSGEGDNTNQQYVSKILQQPFGQLIVGILAVGIMGFGVYQIFRALTGKFMHHIKQMNVDARKRNIYKRAGSIGYTARGIIFAVIGFLFLKAALHTNPSEAKGTEGAISFLSSSFGPWIMVLVATGLFAYGIFMFVKVKNADMHM